MTDTPVVQSGETPESPDQEEHTALGPTLGGTVEERLERMELRLCILAKHALTAASTQAAHGRMLTEVHQMTREAYQLMQSPAVKAMQSMKRRPLLGGGGRHG